MRHLLLVAVASSLLASATGCASVPPWDRERLAHPTMTAQDLTSGLDGHVRAVSEGAAGGLAGAGGGCGCN
jgi:hypothetical protein